MKVFVNAISIIFVSLALTGCNGCSSKSSNDSSWAYGGGDYYSDSEYTEVESLTADDGSIKIVFTEQYGNLITIPVKINGIGLDMIFDTGASSTCITLAEAQYLYEKGKLSEDHIVDIQQFQTADGNISVGLRVILCEVSIGDKIHLQNIEAIVVQNQQAPLLLGQSVMKKFREISVDRENKWVKFYE